MTKSYPFYTPYQFAGNKPIQSIDLDGLEEFEVTGIGGEKGTVYGPYRNQDKAQADADVGTANVTYDLPEASVSSSSSSSSSQSGAGLSSNQFRGGAIASGYNGGLRLQYVYRARKLSHLYEKGKPLNLNNLFGAFERYRFKEFARVNSLGGRAHLDFIDPNGLKLGTRFFRSNIFVNGFGAFGVGFGGYHIYSSGKTLLSIDNAQDRFEFIMAESARNASAIHQMHIASNTYSGVSTRFGLGYNRTINIFGAFTYSGLRAAAGSVGSGLLVEGAFNYINRCLKYLPQTKREQSVDGLSFQLKPNIIGS